jgi:hypothetical protein
MTAHWIIKVVRRCQKLFSFSNGFRGRKSRNARADIALVWHSLGRHSPNGDLAPHHCPTGPEDGRLCRLLQSHLPKRR